MGGPYPYWGANSVVDWIDRYLFNEELVLVGEDGAPFFDPFRDVAFRIHEPAWVNNHIHVLRPRPRTDARFLTYCLNVVDYGRYISGSTRDKLTQEDLNEIRVPFSAAGEQRRVADFLDDQVARIDNVIALREQQLRLLRAMYDSWAIARLSVDMPRVPLRRLLSEAVVGIVVQPAALYTDDEDGVPALRGFEVKERHISASGHVRITCAGHATHRRSQLKTGDVVVVRTGDTGSAARVPEWAGGWNCIDLLVVRAARGVDPSYIEFAINTAKAQGEIGQAASGAMHQHFGVGALMALTVAPLEPEEQRRVAVEAERRYLQLQVASTAVRRSLELLQERKRSLITAAVTGAFDVTTASSRAAEPN